MTVKELIEKLQNIPDSMKDCKVEMYQYVNPIHDTANIYEIKAYVSNDCYTREEMFIEKAEKTYKYKTIVLM